MTKPKRPLPGQFVEITRRVTHRQYLLRPGADTRNLIGYLFGKALLDHNQTVSTACCMSNHIHSTQLDHDATRSAFMQQFFSNATRKRNLELGRRENMWAVGAPGDMVVLDLEAIVREVVYVAVQPVAAHCVEKASEWTGFHILPSHWGKPMRFERPESCGDDMPEFVEFTPMPPPGFEHLPLEEVIAFFEDLIAKEEKRHARRRRGRPVLGIEMCEATSPFYTPKTEAPMRALNPRFAGCNKRQVAAAIRRFQIWVREHRQALNRFRDGDRAVVFPAGTLQMGLRAGVCCGRVGADDPHLTRVRWTSELQKQWDDWLVRRAA